MLGAPEAQKSKWTLLFTKKESKSTEPITLCQYVENYSHKYYSSNPNISKSNQVLSGSHMFYE